MQNDRSKALIDSITDSINTLATMTDATAKSDLFKTWLRAWGRRATGRIRGAGRSTTACTRSTAPFTTVLAASTGASPRRPS